jgi:hypothetical protein
VRTCRARDGTPGPRTRNTPTDPDPVSETNDHRPSAVTATPNGVEGTGAIGAGTVRRAGAGAVAVLHSGARAGPVTGAVAAGRAEPVPGGAAAGVSMRAVAGWAPAEQATAATAATAAAVTAASGALTCPE